MTLFRARALIVAFGLSSLFALTGCGSGDGGSEKSGGGSGGAAAGTSSTSGATSNNGGSMASQPACGASHCETGQYCNNGLCLNGCLTDANCGSQQSCQDIDAETKVGTCKNQPMMVTKDCQAFCQKAQACMDPDFVLCMQVCEGSSAECIACVNDSNCGAGCEEVCDQ